MAVDLFREAVKAAQAGDQPQAQQLLQELLQGQPRHELGWLWLSRLTVNPAEKIEALEKVLLINPAHEGARVAWQQAMTPQNGHGPPDLSTAVGDAYPAAVAAYKAGRHQEAYTLLREVVGVNPKHAKGWLGLSQLGRTSAEKIVALETALRLQPNIPKAENQLKRLKVNHEDAFALGKTYEEYGQENRALAAYKYAAKHAASDTDRHLARKYRSALLARIDGRQAVEKPEKAIKVTNPNITLMRLALGPIIIYGLLIWIQGGLNPLQVPPILYLGAVGLAVGSLLTAAAANTPHHPLWQKILGPDGLTDRPTRTIMSILGLLLIIVPFALLFLAAFNRLTLFREALLSAIK